jgi:hypothetical protein
MHECPIHCAAMSGKLHEVIRSFGGTAGAIGVDAAFSQYIAGTVTLGPSRGTRGHAMMFNYTFVPDSLSTNCKGTFTP